MPIHRYYLSDFVSIQRNSFFELLETGLIEEFSKRNPITSFKKDLEFVFYPEYYRLTQPEYSPQEAILKNKSYTSKLFVPVQLTDKKKKKTYLKWVYIGNIPLMTKRGHFVLNGAARVIVNQILRSPGIYYQEKMYENYEEKWSQKPDEIFKRYYADLICMRGTWLRIEMDKEKKIWAQMKKGPKIPIYWFLLAMGLSEKIIFKSIRESYKLLTNLDTDQEESLKNSEYPVARTKKTGKKKKYPYLKTPPEAWREIYKLIYSVTNKTNSSTSYLLKDFNNLEKLQGHQASLIEGLRARDGAPEKETKGPEIDPNLELEIQLNKMKERKENRLIAEEGRKWLYNRFLNSRSYNLGKQGRLAFNRKLGLNISPTQLTLTGLDVLYATDYLIKVENGLLKIDDIDHLKNRRVRTSGELIQIQIGVGLVRLEKSIRDALNKTSTLRSNYEANQYRLLKAGKIANQTNKEKSSPSDFTSFNIEREPKLTFHSNLSTTITLGDKIIPTYSSQNSLVSSLNSSLQTNGTSNLPLGFEKAVNTQQNKGAGSNPLTDSPFASPFGLSESEAPIGLGLKAVSRSNGGKGPAIVAQNAQEERNGDRAGIQSNPQDKSIDEGVSRTDSSITHTPLIGVKKMSLTTLSTLGPKVSEADQRKGAKSEEVVGGKKQLIKGKEEKRKNKREPINIWDEPLQISNIMNHKAFNSAIREFFGTSPLSQFMDQINPLAELTHKRRLSSMGPGGVTRDTATLAIRGIHPTHYGRICPIETPEGKNTGLVNSMTTYARVNSNGIIESPFYKVYKGQVQKNTGMYFFSAEQEEKIRLAASDLSVSAIGFLPKSMIPVRIAEDFTKIPRSQVQYIGVSPLQMISIAASLIPFLEHDDANRALMGSNMQRQAVPLIRSERPIVGTGLEARSVSDSGHTLISKYSGFVSYVSAKKIRIYSLVTN